MLSLIAIIATFSIFCIHYALAFSRNLRAAKASGLHYEYVPVHCFGQWWLITHRIWLPLFFRLPSSWTCPWLDIVQPDWIYTDNYRPFARRGTDIFIAVSPFSNVVWVADPEAISQITSRRTDFPKPVHLYDALNIYGPNVVSTEGPTWRRHRKATSPPFTESNNHVVWAESIHQAQAALSHWADKTVLTVAEDTLRLSLHVISRAGFGVGLRWSDKTTPTNPLESEMDSSSIPEGHRLSFKAAIFTLLDHIIAVLVVPKWLLAHSPFKAHREAFESFVEWRSYMDELYQSRKRLHQAGNGGSNLDMMSALYRAAHGHTETVNANNEKMDRHTLEAPLIDENEVMGNAFVIFLAGHETAANSIHFSLLFLALNPASQRLLQKDLDHIFADRPVSEWTYEQDLPKLFNGICGAVLNEELRLVPPVISIPKCTAPGRPQPLMVNGRKVLVPGGTDIMLGAAAVHRSPKYWPAGKSSAVETDHASDLDEFNPERWVLGASGDTSSSIGHPSNTRVSEDTWLESSAREDTSAQLFRPLRGSYIPFSDGPRACLGRRFGQIEVLAVLAVFLKSHSVELAVDDFATDAEIDSMPRGGDERRKVWSKADDRARKLLRYGMGAIITLQMRKGNVPIRFVKRGEERFTLDRMSST
ncbi:cytochrome P450 monooxygenase-like protein [Xylona heveae TC161]|uniref:Cytochrome P450 monooxygenase-like protein n=1 Tax=Xylona heveae (strain CBS 132557 / TC161) TaxID=1328760 RepID=A0A165A784_XYLHT|nr:cytochrome P450 monooxygenase-like protein [Xylona heveae TC161]KZF20054.1 cytochrome P450 monooxygenase-like protein [Xylona heveae TC161]